MSATPTKRSLTRLYAFLLAAFFLPVATANVACSGCSVAPSGTGSGPSVASSETTLDSSITEYYVLADWDVENLTIENNTELSDIVVVGEVVRIDTPKWNGPEGKRWQPTESSPDAIVYTSFYIKPIQVIKGEPRWDVPVAFRVTGIVCSPSERQGLRNPLVMEVGDQVVAFGMIHEERWGGGVYDPAEAYWLTNSENSIWVREDDEFASFVNQGLTRYPAEKSLPLASLTSEVAASIAGR